MSPIIAGIIGFLVLFCLIAVGLPIAGAMAVVGIGGLWYLMSGTVAFTKMAFVPFNTLASYDLAVFPLFILMAQIAFVSGLSTDLYRLAHKWLGRQRGGIAMATIAACGAFSAVCGDSVATATTMGLVALPEMKRFNYDPALSCGCVAAGGTLGIIIPPSSLLIIYGMLTGTSVRKLFIAGIVPGVIQVILYILMIYIMCRWEPKLAPQGPSFSFREKIAAFGNCGEVIVLIILLLGGLLLGWFTPTEAGAVGAFGAILFSLVRRRLDLAKFKQAVLDTMQPTGMIYCILIGAFMFNPFLAATTIPSVLAEYVTGLPLPPLAIMGCIIVVYIFLGCIMDAAAMIFLTIPVFFPVATSLGFDPIWFGLMLVMVMEIALITPPIGLNVYVISGISPDVPIQTIFKGIVPFLIVNLCVILLLLFAPKIVLFLPSLI
ncbi:MAG: TRAP transporter large permease [Spirochaetales bacterium]|nr:TRAP transporter large permease [Spirochaetales bacterium]